MIFEMHSVLHTCPTSQLLVSNCLSHSERKTGKARPNSNFNLKISGDFELANSRGQFQSFSVPTSSTVFSRSNDSERIPMIPHELVTCL